MTQSHRATEPVLQVLVRSVLPGLSDQDSADLAATAYEQLEERVGKKLAAGLSDEQLAEFEKLIDAGDDVGCTRWLDRHRPDYPRIAAVEQMAVLGEIVQAVSRDLTAVRGRRVYTEHTMQTFDDLRSIVAGSPTDPDTAGDDVPSSDFGLRLGADGPVMHWTSAESGPPRFMAVTHSSIVGTEVLTPLQALCDGWNANCPAVCLRIVKVADGVRAVAEGAIPANFAMSRGQLNEFIDLVCDATQQAMSLVDEMVVGARGSAE